MLLEVREFNVGPIQMDLLTNLNATDLGKAPAAVGSRKLKRTYAIAGKRS